MITYGDTLFRDGQPPLQTLHHFCRDYLNAAFSTVHILPFFPFSSDDGFSINDFFAVRYDLGTWADIRAIGNDFKLMVDLVVNHVSARSRWFKSYLSGGRGFEQLAIEVDPQTDLSGVTRPRALPLLTRFEKSNGQPVHVWTTFSDDQIDLNYDSLDVLENMVRCLLFYVENGARIIRLDAIAYLWKQIGTPCIHLPQTHDMVRLFRKILDLVAPEVVLITETNVPHVENLSYFGNGADEAQMVYNFTLPPLLLYAMVSGSARLFSDWAESLKAPSHKTTFFNFTASHDGIGVRPLEGILPAREIATLVDRVRQNGGNVSEMHLFDGSRRPYELNITYIDALKDPDIHIDPLHIDRFLASQAVALTLPGMPAVYIHSLLGSRNWTEGVQKTGRPRTINRERLSVETVENALADSHSFRSRLFFPFLDMIRIRNDQPAFHPLSEMQVLRLDNRVFAVKRHCSQQTLFALVNFSADCLDVLLPDHKSQNVLTDLISGTQYEGRTISIQPYDRLWLTDMERSVMQ